MRQSPRWSASLKADDAVRLRPLLRLLREPVGAVGFGRQEWEEVLRSGRRSGLLARVAHVLDGVLAQGSVPDKVVDHLESARRVADSNARFVRWEVRQLQSALLGERIPFALLKGGAYIAADLEAGRGRVLSDVDILVPRTQLDAAERALIGHGWITTKFDAYDQRYYRAWMHELPPMQHLKRGTSLDVHHTILPPTAAACPDIERIWHDMVPVRGVEGCFVPCPVDLVIHSAAHRFYDGEMENGLRDLVDIDALIRSFAQADGFWDSLIERARLHGLATPLHYALEHCAVWLDTPVPVSVRAELARMGAPSMALASAMRAMIRASIGSVLTPRPGLSGATAAFLMYVRSHYLRMPLRLLIPHLIRKQFRGEA